MRHTVTSQLVRHDFPGLSTIAPHEPLKEAFRCRAISSSLKIDIDYFAILIHSTPQILLLTIDLHEDLIDEERIAITMVSPFETTSVSSTKLDTPQSDGFIADSDASFREQIFDVTIA